MRVFVSIADVEAPYRMQDMGELSERMTLWDLRGRCLSRVVHHLEPGLRDISRHFWYNEQFLPYRGERTLIRDITAASSVHLELRPDHYRVRIGKKPAVLFAIDPELPVADVIDRCLGKTGASQCYELTGYAARVLHPERSLWEQGVLPVRESPVMEQPLLLLRHKRSVIVWQATLLAVAVILGFTIGYLLR
ncbi:MAG: hypothetical protein QXI19_07390 [Candidatus Caldarchaeum sp.]